MLKMLSLGCILLVYLFASQVSAQSQKGLWLTDVASKVLDTRQGMDEVIEHCKEYGLEHIYMVVWNRGHTLYPSRIMDSIFGTAVAPRFQGKDILKELILKAHKEDIKVHAWFEFGFSSSYQEEDGGHILRKKPHWKAIASNGDLVSKNGFQWMNAFHPEVQDFLLSLIMEVVQNYEVDGIQGDDRLPANPTTAGYDEYTKSLYAKVHQGNQPPLNPKNQDWVQWRSRLLNSFMENLYTTIKAYNPQIIVSMAPSVYPWSQEEYLQEWPVWVRNKWVDVIIPQIYRYDIDSYTNTLRENLKWMPKGSTVPFVPGILLKVDDYLPSDSFLEQMVRTNRCLGLESEVFFFYEGIKAKNNFFGQRYSKL